AGAHVFVVPKGRTEPSVAQARRGHRRSTRRPVSFEGHAHHLSRLLEEVGGTTRFKLTAGASRSSSGSSRGTKRRGGRCCCRAGLDWRCSRRSYQEDNIAFLLSVRRSASHAIPIRGRTVSFPKKEKARP